MIRLAVRVHAHDAEVALAQLLEVAPAGVEEVELEDGSIEYGVYGAAGELPSLPALRAAVGGALVGVSTTEVADDWGERWKRFHHAVLVGDRDGHPSLRVRPPWEPPDPGLPVDVVIDPGQAFGTGSHPTTRLCLELLVSLAADGEAGGSLSDIGCGSGVLAVAAARLGWGPVIAVDHDPDSIAAANANAVANGVSIDVRRCDVRREAPPPAGTVAANLLRPLLLGLAARLGSGSGGAPGSAPPVRTLLAGGLLREEVEEVAGAFGDRLGLHERARREEGDWAALLMSTPTPGA